MEKVYGSNSCWIYNNKHEVCPQFLSDAQVVIIFNKAQTQLQLLYIYWLIKKKAKDF